jgi:transforming growth factor-beta-induced protein
VGDMKNILETANDRGVFTIFVQAIEAGDLTETLNEEGPFTVFAPDDEAFARLPERTFTILLKDQESLKQVLLFHVASGEIMSQNIGKFEFIRTLQGEELKVDINNVIRIGDANITQTDIKCSNGVIHVIDDVLVPKYVQMNAASR